MSDSRNEPAEGKTRPEPPVAEAPQPTDPNGEQSRLMDHTYDDIQEYDNPLPGWWKSIFVVSIIFSICYGVYYHAGPGELMAQAYETEMKEAAEALAKLPATKVDEQSLAALSTNSAALSEARELFGKHCVTCHGKAGEGMKALGPNFTDNHQKNGKTRLDLYKIVRDGGPEGSGMVAWGQQLAPQQVVKLAAFVASLRGTNAPNGKPPEGDELPPWK